MHLLCFADSIIHEFVVKFNSKKKNYLPGSDFFVFSYPMRNIAIPPTARNGIRANGFFGQSLRLCRRVCTKSRAVTVTTAISRPARNADSPPVKPSRTASAPDAKPIVHSDRGCHYRWPGWIQRMQAAGLRRSMSKKGCSPDNAACEGFFGHLKNEMFYNRSWQGIRTKQFIPILNDYLIWYREKRIKLSLHDLSPIEYRRKLGLI